MTSSTRQPDLTTEAQAHLEQAYVHEETGELEQALQQCERALQTIPDLAEAHNLRGIILEQLGREDQAMDAYRAAIRINSDFEEAKQNLREVQDEISQFQHATHQRRTRKAMLWGMSGYGVSFAIVGAILAIVRVQGLIQAVFGAQVESLVFNFYIRVLGFYYRVYGALYIQDLLGALFYALGSGVGVALIGRTRRVRKPVLLATVGALGFGFAYLATAIPFQEPVPWFLIDLGYSLDTAFTVAATVRFVLIGMCTGALLGIVQKDWTQIGWLTLAGAAGFGLCDLILEWVLFSDFALISPKTAMQSKFAYVAIFTLRDALVGIIAGALLGIAIKQQKPDSHQTGP